MTFAEKATTTRVVRVHQEPQLFTCFELHDFTSPNFLAVTDRSHWWQPEVHFALILFCVPFLSPLLASSSFPPELDITTQSHSIDASTYSGAHRTHLKMPATLSTIAAETRTQIFGYIFAEYQHEGQTVSCAHLRHHIWNPKQTLSLVSKQFASEVHHYRPKELAVLVCSVDCLASGLRDSDEDTRIAIKRISLRQTEQVRKTWKTRALHDQPAILTKSGYLRADFLDKIGQYYAKYRDNGVVRSSSLLFRGRGNVILRLVVYVEEYISEGYYERWAARFLRSIDRRGFQQN
jgi:hypothetical protein